MFVEAIEKNVAAFLMAMGTAGGGEQRDDGEIRWTVGGSPIDYHNAVVGCAVGERSRATELAEEFISRLHGRGVPGTWHHHPGMTAELLEVLSALGFTDGGSEPAMAMRTADLASTQPPADLDIQPVRDIAGLDRYRQVLADGFGEGPREADWVVSTWKAIGLDRDSPWSHYVGTVDGEPASTTTVSRVDDVAGVYFVATRPSMRRRGLGTAITAHALEHARAAGAATAVLASSPMGQRIYERLGFREQFTYRILEFTLD